MILPDLTTQAMLSTYAEWGTGRDVAKSIPAKYIPLSANQNSIWRRAKVHAQANQQQCGLIMQMSWRVGRHCQLAVVKQAFELVLQKYPILTSRVTEIDGRAFYCPLDSRTYIDFEVRDLRQLDDEHQRRYIEQHMSQSFDLQQDALIRPYFLRCAKQQTLIVIEAHQLLMDESAFLLFNQDLWRFYQQILQGITPNVQPQQAVRELNALELQLLHHRSEDVVFWRCELAGAEPYINLPNDSHVIGHSRQGFAQHSVNIGPVLSAKVKRFKARVLKRTSIVLLAALKALLYRYTEQDELVVGLPTKGVGMRMPQDFGQFANTLPIRSLMSAELTFAVLLEQLAMTSDQCQKHGDQPMFDFFANSGERANCNVSFGYHIAKTTDLLLAQFDVKHTELNQSLLQHLALDVYKQDSDYHLCFRYDRSLYHDETVERMAKHYVQLLQQLIEQPNRPLSELICLSNEEQNDILQRFNHTELSGPNYQLDSASSIVAQFEQLAVEKPFTQAILAQGTGISFEQLNIRANQLAHELIFHGIESRTRVAICLSSTIELFIAQLAVMKTGACFVLLEASLDDDVLSHRLSECRTRMLITETALVSQLPESIIAQSKYRLFYFDQNRAKLALSKQANPELERPIAPQDTCQILYVDEGKEAKGLRLTHQAVINQGFYLDKQLHQLAYNYCGGWGWQNGCGLEQLRALSMLIFARTCHLLGETTSRHPHILARYMVDNNIRIYQGNVEDAIAILTTLNGLVSTFSITVIIDDKQISNENWSRLAMLSKENSGQCFVCYGHHETAGVATISTVNVEQPPNIGRPISGTQVYILDAHAKPVPIGVKGEIYVGGIGLAKGYVNHDRYTAERFIPNPFDVSGESRLFKTGDFGRFLPNGHIECVRTEQLNDDLAGFRLGLAEL